MFLYYSKGLVVISWRNSCRGLLLCLLFFATPAMADQGHEVTRLAALNLTMPRLQPNVIDDRDVFELTAPDAYLSADARGYLRRIFSKMDELTREVPLVDMNGNRVCVSAELSYRLLLRLSGEVMLFGIQKYSPALSGISEGEYVALRDSLKSALLSASRFEPFTESNFARYKYIGVRARLNVSCRRVPRL